MAGLLHDVGQLLMFVTDPMGYSEALRECGHGDRSIIDYEQERFGIDHAIVGRELAQRWNLPHEIVVAIGGHHAIGETCPETELADVVHTAEALAHALDLGEVEKNRVPDVCDMSCARMGIDWSEFMTHFPAIEARFDGALLTLGL